MRRNVMQIVALVIVGSVIGFAFNALSPMGISLKPKKKAEVLEDNNIQVVSLDEVRYFLERPDTIIVDARSPEEYSLGHIPEALNIPADEFDRVWEAQRERFEEAGLVICYCSGSSCGSSDEVAELLQERGIEKVAVFMDGIPAWLKAKLPIQNGSEP